MEREKEERESSEREENEVHRGQRIPEEDKTVGRGGGGHGTGRALGVWVGDCSSAVCKPGKYILEIRRLLCSPG